MEQIVMIAEKALLVATVQQTQMGDWLNERLGSDHRWDVDFTTGQFAFSSDRGSITANVHLIASVVAQPASLAWGYSQIFAEMVGDDPYPGGVHTFGEKLGLEEFSTQQIELPEPDPGSDPDAYANEVGHLVGRTTALIYGPQVRYYTAPRPGRRTVLLLEGWSEQPPALDLASVAAWVPRVLPTAASASWTISGLGDLVPGWSVAEVPTESERAPRWSVSDDQGGSITIEVLLDEHEDVVEARVV